MGVKDKVKKHLLKKNPYIVDEYSEYIIANGNDTLLKKVNSYLFVAKSMLFEKAEARLYKGEYRDNKRTDIDEIIQKVLMYDVISFDIFDTLVLRNIEKPDMVFEIMEHKLGLTGFAAIRTSAEKYLNNYDYANIQEIYSKINEISQLDKELWKSELELEMELCIANPYVKEIYEAAVNAGKKVIATSDMYYGKAELEMILESCGYTQFDEIFVSCEVNKSKSDGLMFNWFANEKFKDNTIVHVGDNYVSDISMAQKNGVSSIYIKKCYEIGKEYRRNVASSLLHGDMVANGIINNVIHNGICKLNEKEEFGFIYGGRLCLGYCKFVKECVERNNFDKVVFLSRDSYIINKMYKEYFGDIDTEYALCSRNAALMLALPKYTEMFVDKGLRARVGNTNKNVGQVLSLLGLEILNKYLIDEGIQSNDAFTKEMCDKIIELLYNNMDEVVDSLGVVRESAQRYWKQIIGKSQSIALVDVGWNASIGIALEYFINEVCDMGITIKTIHLGTVKNKYNSLLINNGKILSYCCEPGHADLLADRLKHDIDSVSLVEQMFTSCEDKLEAYGNELKFSVNDEVDKEGLLDIHNGMLKFAEIYNELETKIGIDLQLSGECALEKILNVSKNPQYCNCIFNGFEYKCI